MVEHAAVLDIPQDQDKGNQLLLELKQLMTAAADLEAVIEVIEKAGKVPELTVIASQTLAIVAISMGNFAQAAHLLKNVENHPDASTDGFELLAIIYATAGKLEDSLFYGKLSTAKPPDEKLISLLPANRPTFPEAFNNIQERPFFEAGKRLIASGQFENAIINLEQHLYFFQNDYEALDQMALALQGSNKTFDAIGYLRVLRQTYPENAGYASRLGQALCITGQHEEGMTCHLEAQTPESSDQEDLEISCAYLRDLDYIFKGPISTKKRLLKQVTGILKKDIDVKLENELQPGKEILTVGYVLGRMPSDDDMTMLGKVIARHDRGKIRTVGIGLGDLNEDRNNAFKTACDWWINARDIDKYTLAAILRGENLDVLVDISGIGEPELLSTKSLRSAPVQLDWRLGVGTSIVELGYDGELTDICEGGNRKGFGVLGGLYSFTPPAPSPVETCPSKSNGFVTFGAEVGLVELNRETLDVWGSVLLSVPKSRLLLFGNELAHPLAVEALISKFDNSEIAAQIEICEEGSRASFLREIDILVTAFPYCRPYCPAEALFSGIPVISMKMLNRVCQDTANLLQRLGFSEKMVAANADEYIALARDWGKNIDMRSAFRSEETQSIRESSVFDLKVITRDLEKIYFQAYEAAVDKGVKK